MSVAYRPTDQLHLWWLGVPQDPVYIGELNMVRTLRGVSLRYDPAWLRRGFALSEDLPLVDQEFLPREKDTVAGTVDDARPDRWGERVIRFVDKPPRLSLLEYLYFAGDDRFGALGVSTSKERYAPRRLGTMPSLRDVRAIHELVRKVLDNEPIAEAEKRLIAPGVTMGGARPKALIHIDAEQWVVKFSDGDAVDTPLIEHASMTLAAQAGIAAAVTRAIRLPGGHAVAIRRFDRSGTRRLHALTANSALKAAGENLGYPELAQLLRRRGVAAGGANLSQMRELFRRMVFNILIDNTDDHEKNHALLFTEHTPWGKLSLSPAYDVLPTNSGQGMQEFGVGTDGHDSTLVNAMSQSALFGLKPDGAAAEVQRVIDVVNTWQDHFAECGVARADIDDLARRIDGDELLAQRTGFSGPTLPATPPTPRKRSRFQR